MKNTMPDSRILKFPVSNIQKEECRKKEMCINEQSLLEIEALAGKTLVHWD